MIVVNLTHKDTDLEEVHELVRETTTEEEREAAYNGYMYLFGVKDYIDDRHLETLLNSKLSENVGDDVADTIGELREKFDESRSSNYPESMDELYKNYLTVFDYICFGGDIEEAEEAQDYAASADMNMNISISTERLF